MIPILKLPLDLFLYDFSRWSYIQGVNPIHCEEGTRQLSIIFGWMNSITKGFFLPISGIQFTAPGNLTFTIADVIGYRIGPLYLNAFAALFILLSIGFFIKRLFLYHRSIRDLHSLEKSSQLIHRKVHNFVLSSYLKKYRPQILTSPLLAGSPFVTGFISSIIYIPES